MEVNSTNTSFLYRNEISVINRIIDYLKEDIKNWETSLLGEVVYFKKMLLDNVKKLNELVSTRLEMLETNLVKGINNAKIHFLEDINQMKCVYLEILNKHNSPENMKQIVIIAASEAKHRVETLSKDVHKKSKQNCIKAMHKMSKYLSRPFQSNTQKSKQQIHRINYAVGKMNLFVDELAANVNDPFKLFPDKIMMSYNDKKSDNLKLLSTYSNATTFSVLSTIPTYITKIYNEYKLINEKEMEDMVKDIMGLILEMKIMLNKTFNEYGFDIM
ncbi:hypothetical protein C0J52_08506 [Blattella germanica]|nr:hypothetical protein C0J52_08506 [Blattella germanica]